MSLRADIVKYPALKVGACSFDYKVPSICSTR